MRRDDELKQITKENKKRVQFILFQLDFVSGESQSREVCAYWLQ